MKRLALYCLLVFTCTTASAEQPGTAALPPPSLSDQQEEIEPEVTIIRREDKTIEEYRVNGQLYMVKITPKNAPPYYLIDSDGDGSMDAQRSELEPRLMVPHWMIFRW